MLIFKAMQPQLSEGSQNLVEFVTSGTKYHKGIYIIYNNDE